MLRDAVTWDKLSQLVSIWPQGLQPYHPQPLQLQSVLAMPTHTPLLKPHLAFAVPDEILISLGDFLAEMLRVMLICAVLFCWVFCSASISNSFKEECTTIYCSIKIQQQFPGKIPEKKIHEADGILLIILWVFYAPEAPLQEAHCDQTIKRIFLFIY